MQKFESEHLKTRARLWHPGEYGRIISKKDLWEYGITMWTRFS